MATTKEVQDVLDNATKIIKQLEENQKEDNAMKDGIDFLLNEWQTNKRYFRDEPGKVTTEDVIEKVFQFAWASKRNFDYNKNNPNFNY